ncbi:hypothetical protein ABZ684_17395 [Streptomyces sp. NPDC006995]|uniref:hypothetical protein n=1 Tax=Streptomyces sp. NPDC006995 TaxID=3156907 RepID=UPI0033D5DA02
MIQRPEHPRVGGEDRGCVDWLASLTGTLTTARVAQELAQLSPCRRPGIGYLVRRTGLSEQSVEYHLGMLREAGLLAYIVKGARVRGEGA